MPVTGTMYYDKRTNEIYIFDGAQWLTHVPIINSSINRPKTMINAPRLFECMDKADYDAYHDAGKAVPYCGIPAAHMTRDDLLVLIGIMQNARPFNPSATNDVNIYV